jgi:hypothetical protein
MSSSFVSPTIVDTETFLISSVTLVVTGEQMSEVLTSAPEEVVIVSVSPRAREELA